MPTADPSPRCPSSPARTRRTPAALVLAALVLAGLAACADPAAEGPARFVRGEWPQWRGHGGLGVSPATDLPTHWGPEENVRWKVALPGSGVSQPIVADDRVYLTAARTRRGTADRIVMALSLEDGAVLWESVVSSRGGERKHHRFGSLATPTPVTDGETVWAYFGGYLAALSRDGELLWRVTVDEDYWETSRYGAASSPVLTDRAVIVFSDDEWGGEKRRRDHGSWIAAYDRVSGDEVWRTQWADTCCSYATPLLRRHEGTLELLVASSPSLLAFDAGTGRATWRLDLPQVQIVPSLVLADSVLIQAGSVHDKSIVAYRLSGAGPSMRGERIWDEIRAAPELASPVVYRDLLFTVSNVGVMSCLRPATGEVLWRERLAKGDYRSAIVAADGKLYVTSMGSITSVVAAEPEFRLLAANDLAEISESSLAVTRDGLLLRTEDHLYYIGAAASS